MNSQTYFIRASTQLNLPGVQIAAGNLMMAEYRDREGIAQRGPTAMLWIQQPGDPPLTQQVRAHVGQVVDAGPYTVRIADIGVDEGGGFVQAVLRPAGEDLERPCSS
ncbi:MAG: hypothetical protein JW900_00295 [Anaerolineae bacterium]|nr:hypothetical protein [Anaerolineae bacterium]